MSWDMAEPLFIDRFLSFKVSYRIFRIVDKIVGSKSIVGGKSFVQDLILRRVFPAIMYRSDDVRTLSDIRDMSSGCDNVIISFICLIGYHHLCVI